MVRSNSIQQKSIQVGSSTDIDVPGCIFLSFILFVLWPVWFSFCHLCLLFAIVGYCNACARPVFCIFLAWDCADQGSMERVIRAAFRRGSTNLDSQIKIKVTGDKDYASGQNKFVLMDRMAFGCRLNNFVMRYIFVFSN